jgi:hypothetical protein
MTPRTVRPKNRPRAQRALPDNPLVNVKLRSITVDCADPERMATFWAAALGWSVEGIDHDGAVVSTDRPGKPRLLFLVIPHTSTTGFPPT